MLDECPKTQETKTVLRLVAVFEEDETLTNRLLARQTALEDIRAFVHVIDKVSSFPLEDAIDRSFLPRKNDTTPFRISRFSDGTIGVYYSAIEEDTCKKEVAFHLGQETGDLGNDLNPRTYRLIKCDYQGLTADLCGKEEEYPSLTSATEEGYPFCQDLAKRAIAEDIDGFFVPSARNANGTCVPVFKRESLVNIRDKGPRTATVRGGQLQF